MKHLLWLSVREAAERLGVASTTVYALCQQKRIEHIRVGAAQGAIRISEESLDAYVRRSMVPAEGESSGPSDPK